MGREVIGSNHKTGLHKGNDAYKQSLEIKDIWVGRGALIGIDLVKHAALCSGL